jgi:hypothetical protein
MKMSQKSKGEAKKLKRGRNEGKAEAGFSKRKWGRHSAD